MKPLHRLPTTVVGSLPQPEWLVDRALLAKGVPRVRLQSMWRVPEPILEEAQDDATILAIWELERAGIDIVTDGEMRRESYSNRFATALEGVDAAHPGMIRAANGAETPVPRVVGRIRRVRPVELRDMQFLRRHTDRPAKITLPGPFTLAQQAQNEAYRDIETLAMDFAIAVNEEARGPRGGRRRRHPARRAVAPQRSRGGQALRGARHQSRAGGDHRCRPRSTSASATPRWCAARSPRAIASCPSSPAPPRSRSPSRPRSRSSISACSPSSRRRPSCWA
jgi:hypothetical protein